VTFRDDFSRQAALYSTYRPTYPPELFDFLAGLVRRRKRAWDCATGSGQAAVALSKHFDEVVATDASAEQIAHARRDAKIRYAVAPAGTSGLESHSVDLVTVAQALHWLDLDEFYAEARRVLVLGSVIAVWGYGDPVIGDPAVNAIVHRFNRGTIEKCWAPNRDLLLDGYRTLQFPFGELTSPEFRLEKEWTLSQLAGYVRTWSATNKYIAEHGTDPVIRLEAEIAKEWGGADVTHLVTWPLYLRVGRSS